MLIYIDGSAPSWGCFMDDSLKSQFSSTLVIVVFVMLLVILISPAIVWSDESYQVYTSITWVIRTEQGEPLQAYLTLDQIFAFHRYFFKYIFLWMIYRYYRNRTTLVRALSVGIISEVYLYVYNNLGGILSLIFQVPGSHPHLLSDIPLPFGIISFLILAALIHRQTPERELPEEEWLERNKD